MQSRVTQAQGPRVSAVLIRVFPPVRYSKTLSGHKFARIPPVLREERRPVTSHLDLKRARQAQALPPSALARPGRRWLQHPRNIPPHLSPHPEAGAAGTVFGDSHPVLELRQAYGADWISMCRRHRLWTSFRASSNRLLDRTNNCIDLGVRKRGVITSRWDSVSKAQARL